VLAAHPRRDTARVGIFNALAFHYSSRNPDSGLLYADSAIRLAGELGDQAGLARAYLYRGVNLATRGTDSVALGYYSRALAIARRERLGVLEAKALHYTGLSYFNRSNYPDALRTQNEALDLFRRLGRRRGEVAALNALGTIFLYLSDYPDALKHYLDALRLSSGDSTGAVSGNMLSNLGIVYQHLERYDTALQYYQRALALFQKAGQTYKMQNTLANMGNAYDESGEPRKALGYYREALSINEKLGNTRGIASDVINTGIVYFNMEDFEKAFTYLNRALKLYEQLDDKYGMGIAYTYLSGAYAKAPAAVLSAGHLDPADRYRTALLYQEKGLQLAREIGDLYSESEAWGNLSDIYGDKRDFARALDAYKHHITLRDSIFGQEKKSRISQMQMQYEFDSRQAAARAAADKRQALATAEITRQRQIRNGISLGALVLAAMALVSFTLYKHKRDAEQRSEKAELEAEVADTEMKALRAQMNPHFIFNSLNSISDYMMKHDAETADRYLTKFSRMMRLILEYSEHREITLAEDLEALELYLQLESLRLAGKFTYEIRVDAEIDQKTTLVPPLILQPFVENSIWHGIADKQGKGRILVDIRKEHELINCVIEDNGVGRRAAGSAAAHPGRSLGMSLTKSRIDMMNRREKAATTIKLSDLAEGFRVELNLPLILNF
jgi:tetratricopeptide (TPR) repeat protein